MSDDQPFTTPGLKPRAPVPARVGEPVWTLRKDHHQFDCELRTHGPYGVEVQLWRDLKFFAGRTFPTRELALQWAEEERKALQPPCPGCRGERWTCEQHPGEPWPHAFCAGPGEPCPACNTGEPPAIDPDFRSFIDPKGGA
jgi:hypothetical protein